MGGVRSSIELSAKLVLQYIYILINLNLNFPCLCSSLE